MLKQIFAFNHQNYARYCSYQHVLQSMQQEKALAFQELEAHGYSGSITGSTFSILHGDLLTELFNKETKVTAGPFRSGFSTKNAAVNTWIRTIHIHSKLRERFRRSLATKTSSIHKELTTRGIRLHTTHWERVYFC